MRGDSNRRVKFHHSSPVHVIREKILCEDNVGVFNRSKIHPCYRSVGIHVIIKNWIISIGCVYGVSVYDRFLKAKVVSSKKHVTFLLCDYGSNLKCLHERTSKVR